MPTSPSRGRLPKRDQDIQAQYPLNQVKVWPGGHEWHIDSTKGKERIRFAHKSGTYTEVYHNGDSTSFTVGHAQNVHKGGVTLTVEKNGDIRIGGHSRFLIGGGSHIEVLGDLGATVAGDTILASGGNLKMNCKDFQLGVRGNFNMHVAKDTNIITQGNLSQKTKGDSTVTTQGAATYGSKGNMKLESSGTTFVKGAPIRHNSGGHGENASTDVPSV